MATACRRSRALRPAPSYGVIAAATNAVVFQPLLLASLGFRELPAQDTLVGPQIRPITPTGGCFEAPAVENRHVAPAVSNQSAPLQRSRRPRDADTSHAQHQCEQFVRDMKRVGLRSITGHEEPPRKASLEQVEASACCHLGKLNHQHQQVAIQNAA